MSYVLKAIVPVLAALYVLSPVDLIPDFLIGLGQVDDLGVLGLLTLAAVALIRRLAPRSVVEEHLAAMNLLFDADIVDDRQARPNDQERVIDASFTVDGKSAAPNG